MVNLFRESYYNEKLNNEGYIVIDFLQNDGLDLLTKLYSKSKSSDQLSGFHASMFHQNYDYKCAIDEGIRTVLQSKLNEYLSSEYTQLYANFMVKEQGHSSAMKMHQDWAYVDEERAESFAIWIPIIDLNESNGAFSVVPKSHKLNNFVRGPGIEDSAISQNSLFPIEQIQPLYLKAGQAVIWTHRLVHGSPPNLIAEPRIAATSILVPKDEPVYHFFKATSNNKVTKYKVDRDFYMRYKVGERPQAPIEDVFYYNFDFSGNRIVAPNLYSKVINFFK
ncbi:MAG: phytanoyl-CoA dioxygenase family protein [Chitinophagales bacterium]